MKKLVYNSKTECIEEIDYDTNLTRALGEDNLRSINGQDDFHYIKNIDKLEMEVSQSNELVKNDKVDLKSIISPIKNQLVIVILAIVVILFAFSKLSCNPSSNVMGSDTTIATESDVKSYINTYQYTNNVKLTDWRCGHILNMATGLPKNRAMYVVDSIAKEAPKTR